MARLVRTASTLAGERAVKGAVKGLDDVQAGAVSLAVTHRTVDELWYVLSGRGELWRRQGEREAVVTLEAGSAHSVPLGTWFQFRNPGLEPLVIVIVTMPPWPGMDEALRVPDHWPLPSDDGDPPAA